MKKKDKQIGLKGVADNLETTKQSFKELADRVENEDIDMDVFFFNPEDQYIVNKNTVHILVAGSLILGIVVGSLL